MVASAALLILFVGLAGAVFVAVRRFRERARMRRRMAAVSAVLEAGVLQDDAAETPLRPADRTSQSPLQGVLDRRFPLSGARRTGVWGASAAVAGSAALVPSMAFVGVPLLLALVAGGSLGVALAWGLAQTIEERARQRYSERFLLALEDFERMTRFGIALEQAFRSVAGSAEEPVKSSLRLVVQDADFGVPLASALATEAHRIRISELAMLAANFSTSVRTGGSLSESVGNIAAMQRERLDGRARSKAMTSESKITLVILCCVPFVALGLQAVGQPEVVDELMGEARYLLGIGVGLIATGLVVAWLIVRSVQR